MCCRGGGGSSGGSGSVGRRRCVVGDGADELVSAAAHRPDEALRFAVVAERPPGRLDPAGQRRLTDEPPAPDRVEQLFFGDAPLVVADELGQDVEHLRLDADHLVTVAQFVALGVEDETVEAPHAGVAPIASRRPPWRPASERRTARAALWAQRPRRSPSPRPLRRISPGKRGRRAAAASSAVSTTESGDNEVPLTWARCS